MPSMDTVSNSAYVDAANKQASAIRRAAATDASIIAALATWQRFASTSVTELQDEIADGNVTMSEEQLEHYKHFWPQEKAFVDETFSETKPDENYIPTALTFSEYMEDAMTVGRSLWHQYLEARCETPSLCLDSRWRRIAGINSADAQNYALRQEESRTRALTDRWYSRRKAALALGKGVLDNMASFTSVYGSAGKTLGNFIGDSLNSLATGAGYLMTQPGVFDSWGSTARANTAQAAAPAPTYNDKAPVPTGPYADRIVRY